MLRPASAFGIALFALQTGCAGAPGRTAIERGQFANFRAAVSGKYAAGHLTNAEAAELARASLEQTFEKASPEDAKRLRDLESCARDVDDVLARRTKWNDGVAGEAWLLRVTSNAVDASDVDANPNDARDSIRAITVLRLDGKDDFAKLRDALERDASAVVRRAAVRRLAAAKTQDAADALVEVARVDPDVWVRAEAVRGLRFASHARGDTVANRLRDLWAGADDGLRQDIAGAWTERGVFENGGREAVRELIARESSPGAIAAAGRVLRQREFAKEKELQDMASALVIRAAESGGRREALHAMAVAPIGECGSDEARCERQAAFVRALERRAYDVKAPSEPDVRTAALARVAESPPKRAAAIQALEAIASVPGEAGLPARSALARLSDTRIQAWIEKDLLSTEASSRLAGARALSALGRSARGVLLLADTDVSVRTQAACVLIQGARSSR